MGRLLFEPSSCIRAVTKLSGCTACVDACPVETILISQNNLPSFVPSECVECGGCVGVCPSESFSLHSFNTTDFFFDFAESGETLLSCRINLPCIAVLSIEHLISLSIVKGGELVVDTGHCEECPHKEPLYRIIEESVAEANHILEACGCDEIAIRKISAEADPENPQTDISDRRAFLRAISVKGAAKAKREFETLLDGAEDERREYEIDLAALAKVRQKSIPDKRKILFTALKRVPKPSIYHTVARDEISFLSQKYIEAETCTNCQICYRICPTGALSSDARMSRIYFDAMLCIKCHACHDVCEPDAINIQPTFELKEFFEPTQRLLAKFTVLRCDECGVSFTSLHGERICQRCAIEEEEALGLWGLVEGEDGRVVQKDTAKKDEEI